MDFKELSGDVHRYAAAICTLVAFHAFFSASDLSLLIFDWRSEAKSAGTPPLVGKTGGGRPEKACL